MAHVMPALNSIIYFLKIIIIYNNYDIKIKKSCDTCRFEGEDVNLKSKLIMNYIIY